MIFASLIMLFFWANANANECIALTNLNECQRIIDCFWNSKEGRCGKISEYSRRGNNFSQCGNYKSMDSCYLHLDCFWVAHSGDCEDLSNWEAVNTGHVACNMIDNEDSCWSIVNCFWNRHVMECSQMPNSEQTISSQQPLAPVSSFLTQGPYSQGPYSAPTTTTTTTTTVPSTTTTVFHQPLPCISWTNEDLCWIDTKCFWDRRQGLCLDGTPHLFPVTVQNHPKHQNTPNTQWAYPQPEYPYYQFPQFTTTTTMATTTTILGVNDAMSLCETYDEPTCRADDDCVIDELSLHCYSIQDSDCSRLPSKYVCAANEDCHWSRASNQCESFCSQATDEGKCMLQEDCLWEDSTRECLSVFSSCYKLKSPDSCVLNEVCAWSLSDNACVSLFGPCTRHSDEVHCNMAAQFNTHCEWGENPGQKDVFGCQDPFTTAPPMIECKALIDQATCLDNIETETDMPCIWDDRKMECNAFTFDCEDFLTQDTCEHAEFREIKCFWDGECDFAQAGVLQKTQNITAHSHFPIIVCSLFATLCGFLCAMFMMKCRKSKSTLQEPLSVTV